MRDSFFIVKKTTSIVSFPFSFFFNYLWSELGLGHKLLQRWHSLLAQGVKQINKINRTTSAQTSGLRLRLDARTAVPYARTKNPRPCSHKEKPAHLDLPLGFMCPCGARATRPCAGPFASPSVLTRIATYATFNLLSKHSYAILAIYVWRQMKHIKYASKKLAKTPEKHKTIANIRNIQIKHLQYMCETYATFT
jgi:hypothetical protein